MIMNNLIQVQWDKRNLIVKLHGICPIDIYYLQNEEFTLLYMYR